jgi:hypothetical protein
MTVLDAMQRAAEDLVAASANAALVGGLAVSTRTEPRNTRDVDFAVRVVDDTEAEAVVRALAARGYRVVAVLEQAGTGRLATVRLRRDDDVALLDLLFASSGIEPEVVEEAESLKLGPGAAVLVARIGHLIAMKLLSRDDVRRPQDRVDLAALVAGASEEEIRRAERACRLIAARGCSRGRDLEAMLSEAVATWGAVLP